MVYTLRQSAIMLHDGHREQQPTLRQVVSLVRALSHRDFSYYRFRVFVVLKNSLNRTVDMVLNRYEWERLPLAHVNKPKLKIKSR